jgi:2'-5' RNA ligase
MRLNAALMPSAEAVEHLAAALRDPNGEQDQVHWLKPAHWNLHLASFGNVARTDLEPIEELLAAQVATREPIMLRLAHVVPLPEPGDTHIWVEVHGDIDGLSEVAYAIPTWVRPTGFVLDRRSFRSRVQLGRVTARTTPAYLEALVERLGSYMGPVWSASSLMLGREARHAGETEDTYVIEAELPFGPRGRHAAT